MFVAEEDGREGEENHCSPEFLHSEERYGGYNVRHQTWDGRREHSIGGNRLWTKYPRTTASSKRGPGLLL